MKFMLRSFITLFLIAGLFIVIRATHLAFDGPGLGNIAFTAAEVFKPIFIFKESNGAKKGHSNVAMHKGYLIIPGAPDSGVRGGGFAAYDVSDPRNPKLIISKFDASTNPMREAHGFGFSSSYAGDYVVMQTISGIIFWDWTNIAAPKVLSQLTLPGVRESDYDNGNWWISWQAPYVYIGGSSNGLYIVDAKDPSAPKLIKQVPKNSIGGFNVGTVFAIGNLLVTAMPENGALGLLDISDPVNPKLLDNITGPDNYSVHVVGNKIYGAGGDGRLYSYDISDHKNITAGSKSVVVGGKGGYLSYQDGYIFMGSSTTMAKIDVRNDADLKVVGKGTSNLSGRDEDFAMVLGNMVFVGNDHETGSALIPHQTGKDLTGPSVTMISPKNNSTAQAVTSRVGVSMSDNIDLRTVDNTTFIVRPVGGSALPGKYSHMFGIINFCPDVPFETNTIYEVVLPEGGIKDISGNAIAAPYTSKFSTGTSLGTALEVNFTTSGPRELNKAVTFEAKIMGTANGPVTYSWDFGDGSPVLTNTLSKSTHTYTSPGHYIVKVQAKDNSGTGSANYLQTIYLPGTALKPASSSTIIYDEATSKIWNTNPDNHTVTISDAIALTKTKEMETGKHPRTLAKAPNGNIWVTNQDDATISIFSATGTLIKTISLPYASQPYGIVTSPDESAIYVSLQATGRLLKLAPTGDIISSISVGSHPRAIAISANSKNIFVTRFISPQHQGEVTEVDATTFEVKKKIKLGPDSGPDTEASGRGVPNFLASITITPDGSEAWVAGKKDNTSRGKFNDGQILNFENTVRAIASRISLGSGTETMEKRIDLDNRDSPTAIAFSKRGDYAFIAAQGNNLVEVLDAYKGTKYTAIENSGSAPQGLILSPDGNKLFVHNFLSRSVSVFNIQSIVGSENNNAPKLAEINTVLTETLTPEVLKGKTIFYSADTKMTQTGYISCATCHVDGGSDGRNWDFSDRGEGIRNTIALNGRAGTGHGRLHWSANFDEVQDFENDIRLSFKGTGFITNADFVITSHTLGARKKGLSIELDAIAAYVTSLNTFEKSPYRNEDGALTGDGIKGKMIFEKLKCGSCHNGANFTDSDKGLLHDVGTTGASSGGRMGKPLLGLDVPTLRDVWNTAPYLHDGSAATLYDVLITKNKEGKHGETATLTRPEAEELVAYVKQIDQTETAPTEPVLSIKFSTPLNNSSHLSADIIPLSITTDISDITEVIYYANGLEIARSSTAPFLTTWKGMAGVKYELHAKALHGKLNTISPEVNISVKSAPGQFFSSVKSKNTSVYEIAEDITAGMAFRTDKAPTVDEVIPELENAEIILSPDADKTSVDANLLSIQVAQQGTIFVGFDPRALSIPDWLKSWTKTSLFFKTSDQDFIIYEKNVTSGTVVIGGNNAFGSAGAASNYVILGKEGSSLFQAKITAPKEGAVYPSGTSIPVSTTVTPNTTQVARIDYYVNHFKIGSSTIGPSYTFNWTAALAGNVELIASVIDKDGQQIYTSKVGIQITGNANLLPEVNIKSPINKTTYTQGDQISATVQAADPENDMERVDYYLNSRLVGSSSTSPYNITFIANESGDLPLTAVAVDKSGLCSEPSLEALLKILPSALGVEDDEMIVGLSISPNPAQNYIVLSASFPLEVSNVTLISLEGHKITLPTLYRFSKEVGVDISAIKAGLYLLELKHLEGVLRSKIMVE